METTIRFNATVGVVEGYKNQNIHTNQDTMEIVSNVWQEKAKTVYEETGIYVSAIVNGSKAIYHTDWGCPVGGENIANITGDCNPQFVNIDSYKESVIKVLKLVKDELKQSTVQVSFSQVELHYIQ